MKERGSLVRIVLLSIASVAISLMALSVTMSISNYYPITATLSSDLFKEWIHLLQPERETFLYRFFVLCAIALQCLGASIFLHTLRPLTLPDVRERISWSWKDLVVLGVIFAFIFIPDMDAVLSRVNDHFYHIDSFFMAPGWSVLSGLTLNMDVITEYGVVIPTLLARTLGGFGHFDYLGVFTGMILVSCLYFCGFYLFLRLWLGSIPAAIAGLIAAIGFQMFHSGVFPIVWQFPSGTVIRFLWDIPALLLILMHLRKGRLEYLWAAAVIVGVSMTWVVDAGAYLYLTFVFYLLMTALRRGRGGWQKSGDLGLCLVIPFIVAFIVIWIVSGQAISSAQYWRNSFELASLFLQGFGALPMTTSLKYGRWFVFSLGLAIPVLYTLCLLCTVTACLKKRVAWENILVAVLCVYGLALYHYYVVRSAPTSFAAVCLPLVAVGSFGLKWIASQLGSRASALWAGVFVLLVVYLRFDPLVQDYPGIWNPVARSKAIGMERMESREDVALIDRLTSPNDRVPVFSSFEVKTLMDAARKPYFYYFPLVHSLPMDRLEFDGTYLHTRSRMAKTLQALETDRPIFVFVEKKLFLGILPEGYYGHFETMAVLMDYLHKHYEPIEHGKYLLALKRKTL